jgi:hypothetical protein
VFVLETVSGRSGGNLLLGPTLRCGLALDFGGLPRGTDWARTRHISHLALRGCRFLRRVAARVGKEYGGIEKVPRRAGRANAAMMSCRLVDIADMVCLRKGFYKYNVLGGAAGHFGVAASSLARLTVKGSAAIGTEEYVSSARISLTRVQESNFEDTSNEKMQPEHIRCYMNCKKAETRKLYSLHRCLFQPNPLHILLMRLVEAISFLQDCTEEIRIELPIR